MHSNVYCVNTYIGVVLVDGNRISGKIPHEVGLLTNLGKQYYGYTLFEICIITASLSDFGVWRTATVQSALSLRAINSMEQFPPPLEICQS